MSNYYFVTALGIEEKSILKMPEWTFISQDPANPLYQQYLAWVAEGNTAEEWSPDASD
jgi:hypothetical protein